MSYSTFLGMRDAPICNDTLGSWFGTSTSVTRDATIGNMETAMGQRFAPEQKTTLQSCSKPFTFLDSSPGGGKTFLMEAITIHILQSLPQRKLVVTLRTQALAEQFANRVDAHAKRLGLSSSVARVGWDRHRWIEHFEQAVADRAASKCPTHMSLSELLDVTISFAHDSCDNDDICCK